MGGAVVSDDFLDQYAEQFLSFLNQISPRPLRYLEELSCLESHEILQTAAKCPDSALPLFVHALKKSPEGVETFQKLMGDHEDDNIELVNSFFDRYMNVILSEEDPKGFNPLIHYIPEESFNDLVFLQSRKDYFCAQEMDLIMQFLRYHFENEAPEFIPGEQISAWNWFWNTMSASGEDE